jgi:MSHA pilin protein MshC
MDHSQQHGFSLVELIIVIVVLGIVSVTSLPKILGKGGTEEITAQDQIISVLRRMQIQAMQQTDNDCHVLQLSATQLTPTGCTIPVEGLSFILPSDSELSFSPSTNLAFDSLGKLTPGPTGVTTLVILSAGVPKLNVCIESEGYIHPC